MRFLSKLLACAFVTFSVHAEDEAAEDQQTEGEQAKDESAIELIPVYVHGDRVGLDPRQRGRSDTVTVVGRGETELHNATVVFDLLGKKPGLSTTQRTGFLGTGLNRLTIRGQGGAGPAGVQVFVDGRPDPTVSFVHPIGQSLGLERGPEVEVIHGPSPVLHGSGKAGVVNLTTVRPGPGFGGMARVRGGSFGTIDNLAMLGYGGSRGFARFSGAYRTTDGDIDDTEGEVRQANLRVGFDVTRHWSVEAGFGRSLDEFETPGSIDVLGPFGSPGTETLDLAQTTGDITLKGTFDGLQTSLQLWGNELDPQSQVVPQGIEKADVYETGLRFRTDVDLAPGHTLTFGTDVVRASAENTPPPAPGVIPPDPDDPRLDVDTTEIGPYLFYEGPLTELLRWHGGVRLVYHSEFGTEPVGDLGLQFRPDLPVFRAPDREAVMRLRATRGYQSPALQQLFGVFTGGLAGPSNPDLDPERLDQLELGWNQRIGDFEFDIVGWIQDAEKLIGPVGPRPPTLRNTGTFTNQGLELRTVWHPARALTVMVGGTTRDLDDGALRTPEDTLDFEVTYAASLRRSNDLVVSIFGRRAWNHFDLNDRGLRVRLPNYFVADLKLIYRATDSIRPFFQVDNFTDEDYQTWFDIPMPGIAFSGGVTLTF